MVPRRNLASANSAAAPRILIVDDEPYMCDVCSRTLQRGGYEVVSTSDPQAAAAMLRSEEHFDLLLTDIKMPSISGLELAYIAPHHRDHYYDRLRDDGEPAAVGAARHRRFPLEAV